MPTGSGNFQDDTMRGTTVCALVTASAGNADRADTEVRDTLTLNVVTPSTTWVRVIASLALLAAVAAVIASGSAGGGRSPGAETAAAARGDSALYFVEQNGLRYEFHAVMGTELLTRVGTKQRDAHNLIREMPEIAAALRAAVAEREGVPSVESLRERHGETIESLRRLGYL